MADTSENAHDKYARQAKWRATHPKESWAHACLRSALKRGLVIQERCEVCGSPDSEAHHPNYDQPMVVQWFCRQHHRDEHRRLRAEDAA